MRISNNNVLIQRNKKISQIVLYSALGLLTLSFLWSPYQCSGIEPFDLLPHPDTLICSGTGCHLYG